MNNWVTRIKSRMKELNITQEALASKMGLTRGAITHYLAGRRVPPLRQFQKLAAILKADPAWLQFGTQTDSNSKKIISEKEKREQIRTAIPVLSWEQVSEFIGATKIPQHEIKEYLPEFYTGERRWYALRIKNDAMTATHGNKKSFHEGDIIIVDPEKQAKHGHFAVAILPNSKEATFKHFVIDGGVRYLKPLNPQYPITQIDDATHICGVVIGCLSLFIS